MSVVYLGNILGATGPSGPSGPLGCPSCFNFVSGEWSQSNSNLSISASSNDSSFFISCWGSGEPITINGRNENNIPTSEHLIISSIDQGLKQITTNSAFHSYDENYPLTMCFGNNIGATGPSNGPSGPSGATGPSGASGPPGPSCSGSSTDSLSLSHFSTDIGEDVSITTDANRCWTIGQLLIVSNVQFSSDYLIVRVLNYAGAILTFKVIKRVGTLTANEWSINITGDLGPSGPVGATGPVGGIGSTGPIGLPGAGSLLRGSDLTSNPEIYLNGGTIIIDVRVKDIYNLCLKQSSKIKIINFNPGQVVYLRVKTDKSNAVLTWENPANNADIYWEDDVIPTQTTIVGKSTIYKFAALRYDPQSQAGNTLSVFATHYGCFGPLKSTSTPMTFNTEAREALGLAPVNSLDSLDICDSTQKIKIFWQPKSGAYGYYHHAEVFSELFDGSRIKLIHHVEVGSYFSIPGYYYFLHLPLKHIKFIDVNMFIHNGSLRDESNHVLLSQGKVFINCNQYTPNTWPFYSTPFGWLAEDSKHEDGKYTVTFNNNGFDFPLVQIDFGAPMQLSDFSIANLRIQAGTVAGNTLPDNYVGTFRVDYGNDPMWETYNTAATLSVTKVDQDFSGSINAVARYVLLSAAAFPSWANLQAFIDQFIVNSSTPTETSTSTGTETSTSTGTITHTPTATELTYPIYTAPNGGIADNARTVDGEYVVSNYSNYNQISFVEIDLGPNIRGTTFSITNLRFGGSLVYDAPSQFRVDYTDDSSWATYSTAAILDVQPYNQNFSGAIGEARYVRLMKIQDTTGGFANVDAFVINISTPTETVTPTATDEPSSYPIYSAPNGGIANNAKIEDGVYTVSDVLVPVGFVYTFVQLDFGTETLFSNYSYLIKGLSFSGSGNNYFEIQVSNNFNLGYDTRASFLVTNNAQNFSGSFGLIPGNNTYRYVRLAVLSLEGSGVASVDSFTITPP